MNLENSLRNIGNKSNENIKNRLPIEEKKLEKKRLFIKFFISLLLTNLITFLFLSNQQSVQTQNIVNQKDLIPQGFIEIVLPLNLIMKPSLYSPLTLIDDNNNTIIHKALYYGSSANKTIDIESMEEPQIENNHNLLIPENEFVKLLKRKKRLLWAIPFTNHKIPRIKKKDSYENIF